MSKKSDFLYNNWLPEIYRMYDTQQILKRFLDVLCEYGIDVTQEYIKNYIIEAYNVDKMSLERLKHFAQNFGYKYLNSVPEDFQRRLIKHLPYLYTIKGTKPCINYLARDLTGYDCEIIENYTGGENYVFNGSLNFDGRTTFNNTKYDRRSNCVAIKLNGREEEELPNMYTRDVLKQFLPYNIDPLMLVLFHYIAYPLKQYKTHTKHNIKYYPKSTPFIFNIDKSIYFDGETSFNGENYFNGGTVGRGTKHTVNNIVCKNINHKVGSKREYRNTRFNGYAKFDGEFKFNHATRLQKLLIFNKNNFNVKINMGNKNKQKHEVSFKRYTLSAFNGQNKFDGQLKFDGGIKLKESGSL